MFNIEKFLEKFSKNIKSIEIYKKQISEIILNQTQINILPEDIEIKNNTIYTSSSPAVLNKIFIHKNKILEEIGKSLLIKIVDIK